MTFGFALILDNNATTLFTSSVEKWPSSSRAETMAILTALIVILASSNIDIFTDSESSIKHFNNLKAMNFQLSARNTLKQQHNLHIWNNICEVIISLNLHVDLHYVKAHSGNIWNEYIDEHVKLAHNDDSTSVITLTAKNLNTLKFVPRWNKIIIEQSIRKFISLTSNVIGFESFFNLYRNKKYHRLNIDWATFAVLHYGLPVHDT